MSVRAVLRNIHRKGLKAVLEMRKERKAEKARQQKLALQLARYHELSITKTTGMVETEKVDQLIDEMSELEDALLDQYTYSFRSRPFHVLGGSDYQNAMENIFELEKTIKVHLKKDYRRLKKLMKACYVRERIPELYETEAKEPVLDKVVFVENGNCPSPSNAHLISELKRQGKYKVITMGLKRRRVSELEYYENSLKFIREAARAKAVFISSANDLLSSFDVRPETKVIQLWHGLGAFKKVGYSTVDNPNFGKNAREREEYDQYRNYSYVTLPAKSQAWVFEDAMHIPQDSGVLVDVGVARTDVFYNDNFFVQSYEKLYEKFPQIRGKKIILYAPTFRGAVAKGKAPDALNIATFAERLSGDYILLIKHHGLAQNPPEVPDSYRGVFAFDLSKDKFMSIDRLLSVADILITDYSSLGFEFAILERPMVFFAYDLEEYIDKRGMYYDYEEITPGPVCRTNEEMIDYIVHLDERFDKQAVIDFKNKYVGRCDGHAVERTIALIDS